MNGQYWLISERKDSKFLMYKDDLSGCQFVNSDIRLNYVHVCVQAVYSGADVQLKVDVNGWYLFGWKWRDGVVIHSAGGRDSSH